MMKDLPLSKVYQLLEPGPVVLLTTAHKGRANVMTMSWHMMVEFEPPLVACVVSSADYSFAALRATKECVIAIPALELAPKVVKVGNCSGRDVDKFETVRSDAGSGRARGAAAGRRMFRQSRMQGGRHAPRQQVQPLRSRSAQGLDRSGAKEPEDHPPSRIRQVRRGWRDDQAEIENAATAARACCGRGRQGPICQAPAAPFPFPDQPKSRQRYPRRRDRLGGKATP